MAYEQRRLMNNLSGTLAARASATDSQITCQGSAPGITNVFAALPTDFSQTLYMPLVLANDATGKFEIVWVTGHSSASPTLTVVRNREGTEAQTFEVGDTVRCAATQRDLGLVVANRAALPADPHLGLHASLLDEGIVVERSPFGWQDSAPLVGDPARRHHWQQTGAGATTPPGAGTLISGMGGSQVGTAGTLATLTAGKLKLNKVGHWVVKLAGFGPGASGDTFGVGMKWTSGAFLTIPYQISGRGNAASLSECVWDGYATSAHIANTLDMYCYGSGTIAAGAQYDVTAEFLGA